MGDVITIENAELAYDAKDHESTQARLGGRGKFNFCRRCGSEIGMQAVHRNTLVEMTDNEIEALEPWSQALWDMDYLYYPCPRCNREKIILDNFHLAPMPLNRVLDWRNEGPAKPDYDPMAPDYEALAAETEAATAGQDSRAAAGLEG